MRLVPVTPANLAAGKALSVAPEQQAFIGSFDSALTEAETNPQARLRLGVVDSQPIGYLLLVPGTIDGYRIVNIARLMIDRRWQNLGFGRRLLEKALCWIETFDPDVHLIRIAALPDNEPALALYQSVGFVRMNIEAGEVALYLLTKHLLSRG